MINWSGLDCPRQIVELTDESLVLPSLAAAKCLGVNSQSTSCCANENAVPGLVCAWGGLRSSSSLSLSDTVSYVGPGFLSSNFLLSVLPAAVMKTPAAGN